MTTLADGLDWVRIYWTAGSTKRKGLLRPAVSSPPCSGWMCAFVLPGEKKSTIFCPYTFEAFTVPNDCAELRTSKPEPTTTIPWLTKFLRKQWAEMQARGWHKDYDTAALVFRRLGVPVPEQVLKGGEEDNRKKGGKEAEDVLKKPVKLSGKRGQFLKWFLENGGSASVREAMAEFGSSRSNVLSYLFILKRDHGVGYDLVGDTATVNLPGETTNPFDVDWTIEEADDDDDGWLD